MTDTNAIIDTLLAQNGLSDKIFSDTKLRTMMVVVQSQEKFAVQILPAELATVKSSDDVEVAIQRVVSDDAYFLSTLRGLALYIRAKFDGKEHDKEAVQKFYDLYQTSSPEDQLTAKIGTYRLLIDILGDESARCVAKDGKEGLGDIQAQIAERFESVLNDDGIEGLSISLEQPVSLLVCLGQVLAKAEEIGDDVETARDINRKTGQMNCMFLEMISEQVGGKVVQATIQSKLTPEQYEIFDAQLDKAIRQEEGSASVH